MNLAAVELAVVRDGLQQVSAELICHRIVCGRAGCDCAVCASNVNLSAV